MAAGEFAVVIEHGTLELEPLLEEGQLLDLALRLVTASVIDRQRGNVLNNPHVGTGRDLLVAVDLLLLVAPIRKCFGMSPHGNLAGVVNELEVARDRLENLVLLAMLDSNLKQAIILALANSIFNRDASKLLVGGVVRRCHVVGEENLVSTNVSEAHQVVVFDFAARLLVVVHGKNLPVVVGVIVRVTGDLLTLAGNTAIVVAEGVLVLVAVEVGLGLLVTDANAVVIMDIDRVGQHDIVAEGLLELWGHEVVSRT